MAESLRATKREELLSTLGEDRMYRAKTNPHQSTRAWSATEFGAPTLEVGFTVWGEALRGMRCRSAVPSVTQRWSFFSCSRVG